MKFHGGGWEEIAELVGDAYRMVAPKRLLAELDARSSGQPPGTSSL